MSTSILSSIQNQLNLYSYRIFLILGNIGNLFVVIIFSRQRKNACAIYLLSAAIMNDFYLTFNSLVQIYPFDYSAQTSRDFALCKIRFYVSNVFGQLAKTMIVFACIDRYLITNTRATLRAYSGPRRAKICVLLSIPFWLLFASHIAIMTTITNQNCGTFGTYSTIYTIYTVVFVGFIPPLLLAIFGYLTKHNIKQIHTRVQPVFTNQNNTRTSYIRRVDRELLIIVISEVSVYVVTTSLYPLILLERMISRNVLPTKSVQYSNIEDFIFTICFLLIFVNSAAPFYIYLIASKSFREDFKNLFITCYRKLKNRRQVRIMERTNIPLSHRHTRD